MQNHLKTEIERYWTKRAESFADLRIREFQSYKHDLWQQEIGQYLPPFAESGPLQILDIGTGTGFFTFLLSEMGHEVTGIDLTPEMIVEARISAEQLGLTMAFLVMDAEKLAFPEAYFDVIVTRNLTWTLPHLAEAYRSWYKVLRPGGILINFDADYVHTEEHKVAVQGKCAHEKVDDSEWNTYLHFKEELAPEQKPRPAFDEELLAAAGFTDIAADLTVSDRLFAEKDEFYMPVRMFCLTARK